MSTGFEEDVIRQQPVFCVQHVLARAVSSTLKHIARAVSSTLAKAVSSTLKHIARAVSSTLKYIARTVSSTPKYIARVAPFKFLFVEDQLTAVCLLVFTYISVCFSNEKLYVWKQKGLSYLD